MQVLSESKQKTLDTIQALWKRANLHPSKMEWTPEIIEAFGFYDNSGQWALTDLETVTGRGQVPLTVNLIQSRLDALSGVEIQSRFRTAVQDASGSLDKERLAHALTSWLYFIQKDQRIPHKGSLKFKDMLICGAGWSNSYQENGSFIYDYVSPFNILPDMDDLSPQFDNMKYVCRKRWLEPDVVKKLWPKVSSYIDFSDPNLNNTVCSPEIMDRNNSFTDIGNYSGYSQSRVLVCEVQYKQPRKAYSGLDINGFYFETFDEEKAEQLAESSQDIEVIDSNQIIRSLFLDNYLLETAPLNPNIPGLKDFSYIPCIWKRRASTGVPYGLLDGMKDIQRDSNVRLTKALYLANSSKLFITGSLPSGQSAQDIEQKLKRPDSVIVLPPETTFDLKSNDPLSDAQLKMLDRYELLMNRVTGIHDDMMGIQTNASSGVAQRQRQINSVRNNVFAFDNFADMKERESRFMLSMFQGGGFENIQSQVVTEDQKETIILNLSREINGKKVIFNDVRTLPISLDVEEVPDFKNSMEENREALENLLSNPNAMLIMQSPSLMRRLGIRDYEKLSQEMQETMAKQMQSQEGGSPVSPRVAPQAPEQQNLAYSDM
jgi:hypothetical protein